MTPVDALVKNDTATALAVVPDYMRADVGSFAGLEDIGREDVSIPRLCVAQSLSPQINKKKDNFIAGLEVGDFFNSVTGENYGKKVTVIPLFFFRQFIEFKPIEDGGGIVAMYQTAADIPAHKSYVLGPNGEKPAVTEFKNEMVLLITEDGSFIPIVCSFKSSGLKTARDWNALLRMPGVINGVRLPAGMPAYTFTYILETVSKTKGTNEWEGIKVARSEPTPGSIYAQAKEYFGQLREAGVKVDTTGLGPDEGAGSTGAAAEQNGDTSF